MQSGSEPQSTALHGGHPRSPSAGARHQWTRKRLHSLITQRLEGFRFVCVGNREPYIHMRKGGAIRCIEPDSGVVTALGPVLRATGGTWVAHGSGTADRETADERGRLKVPPGSGHYTLRRIWLTPDLRRLRARPGSIIWRSCIRVARNWRMLCVACRRQEFHSRERLIMG